MIKRTFNKRNIKWMVGGGLVACVAFWYSVGIFVNKGERPLADGTSPVRVSKEKNRRKSYITGFRQLRHMGNNIQKSASS